MIAASVGIPRSVIVERLTRLVSTILLPLLARELAIMPNEFAKESDKAYWSWSYKHLDMLDRELPSSRTSFNAGFYLGAQYATRVTGEMSPHLARFLEFVMWLTDRPESSTTPSTKTGSSNEENNYLFPEEEQDPNGYAVLQSHHLQGHRTELRVDDSVYCLDCRATVAVADG